MEIQRSVVEKRIGELWALLRSWGHSDYVAVLEWKEGAIRDKAAGSQGAGREWIVLWMVKRPLLGWGRRDVEQKGGWRS